MNRNVVLTALGLTISLCACAGAHAAAPPVSVAQADPAPAPPAAAAATAGEQTLQGELVDLNCYLDHGAKGEGHKACGTTCALKGLPIGLLDKENRITLVVGAHERPMNTELAEKMGTTVELTGKVVSRNGLQMIEVSAFR